MANPRLAQATLSRAAPNVAVPRYDRARLTPGIVHIGVGGFHRAHQAAATEDCLNRGERGWGVVGASLRGSAMRDALAPQDFLYALALRDSRGETLRIVGAIQDILAASPDPEPLLARMANSATRIVSLTITEKGYTTDLATGDVLWDHPDVARDLAGGGTPRTALGLLAVALRRRHDAGVAPFTILSCDNLPNNGPMLRRSLIAFLDRRDPALRRITDRDLTCPATMVDRIAPATTDEDRRSISQAIGLEDAWPAVAEPFFQWVIEDQFALGRPNWEASGAQFVADVAPFEHMKLRLLNGAHSAIAATGRLAGYDTIARAIADPSIRTFIKAYWSEVVPTIGPAIDAEDYVRRLLVRFDNTALRHLTAQIATDASQKIPQRLLAPLRERRAAGARSPAMIFALAAWIRSCAGFDDSGAPLPVNDPVFERWSGKPDQRVAGVDETVRAFLSFTSVFGGEAASDAALAEDLRAALDGIRRSGVRAAMQRLTAQPLPQA